MRIDSTPSSERTFLPLDAATARDPHAPYAVLPLPYERTVSYGRGTADGPGAILDASQQVEDFDEEFQEPLGLRVQTLRAPPFADLPDPEALELIGRTAGHVFARHRFLLSLGGEHTVTAPLVAAAHAVHGSLSVLHIDAHADLRSEYRGTPLSHACVMRHVREMGVRTVSVGVRSLSAAEHDYAQSESVPIFWAADIAASKDEGWIAEAIALLEEPVYVTFDIDGFDPSLVPGTGTPEPGGLTWRQATRLLRAVCEARRVIGADIVELSPLPAAVVSEFVAARLATKILLYHKHGRRAKHKADAT